ncbi:MAG: ABC transporter substrate-binding protein [Pseudomonadales bacterium]|nr:ABC transporter substrate-binding protein [Pseudomonadales bacterium]
MIYIKKALFVMLLAALLPAGAWSAELTAVESAEQSVNQLLAKVRELRPLYDSDRDAYFAGIEQQIGTFVDFTEVARGVMANFADQASEAQIVALGERLRATLTRFYGSTLLEYGDQELTYLPPREPPQDPENATNVRMQINNNGTRVELQYTMFLTPQGEWKLKNLFLGGINLRRQYYTQFSALMSRHGNDIDAVIENWQ